MYVSVFNVVVGSVAALALYLVGVVFYRLTFHPLAKYPGPFFAKISDWYDAYHCLKKDRHLDQYRCHQKYGSIVRYGPNSVIINTSNALRDIYAGPKSNNIQKGPPYKYLHDLSGSASTHSIIDKDAHAVKRRIMLHGFSEQALRGLEPYMIANVNKWTEVLGSSASEENKGWTSPINMAAWANYLTFDVLGDLCFGKPFGMINDDTLRDIPEVLLARSKMFHAVGHSPILDFWRRWVEAYNLHFLVTPGIAAQLKKLTEFAGSAMKERLAQADMEKNASESEARKDFVYWLLRGQDPETGHVHSQSEFVAESRLLITAGSDTSAITIAAACWYLCRDEKRLQRLQDEIRSHFNSSDEIVTGPELSKCHYLRAVIDEALRMTPPVGSSLVREVTKDGINIDGAHFAAGTLVGTSAYAIHHSEDYYEKPYSFRPERWLAEEPGTTAEEVAAAKSAFCPFSLGTRGCVGKQMAYNELSIALGRLFYIYDMRLTPGDHTGESPEGDFGTRDVFVAERNGPMIQLRKHE